MELDREKAVKMYLVIWQACKYYMHVYIRAVIVLMYSYRTAEKTLNVFFFAIHATRVWKYKVSQYSKAAKTEFLDFYFNLKACSQIF